jgi:KaiC/GvpD/RAD55 family RecA-like ATPase
VISPEENATVITKISTFISTPTNTLLIRGDAGTGKTTLCLELVRRLAAKRRIVYISTRVSQGRLEQEYPGISRFLGPGDSRNPDDRAAESSFEDLRLGKSSQVLSITLEVLQQSKKPLIIYDSWESLTRELEPTERLKVEKTLLTAIDGGKGNAVFVGEELRSTNIAFGTDGVVTLSSTTEDDVRLRKMVFDKLRGLIIRRPVRYFTLQGGRFGELPELGYRIAREPKRFKPLPNSEDRFSSGVYSLDKILGGGLKRGSVLLFDLAPNANRQYLAANLGIVFLNFLNQGNAGLVGLSPDADESKVLSSIRPYSDAKSMSRLKIVRYRQVSEMVEAYERIKEEVGKDTLVELDVTFLKQEENFNSILDLCREVREHKDILMVVTRRPTEYLDQFRAISDLNMKVWQVGSHLLARELTQNSRVVAMKFALVNGTPSLAPTEVV